MGNIRLRPFPCSTKLRYRSWNHRTRSFFAVPLGQCLNISISIYANIYICNYRDRERERCIYVQIYIYIHINNLEALRITFPPELTTPEGTFCELCHLRASAFMTSVLSGCGRIRVAQNLPLQSGHNFWHGTIRFGARHFVQAIGQVNGWVFATPLCKSSDLVSV